MAPTAIPSPTVYLAVFVSDSKSHSTFVFVCQLDEQEDIAPSSLVAVWFCWWTMMSIIRSLRCCRILPFRDHIKHEIEHANRE
eukprot:scaffold1336_cov158-Cylindrotheca_fusiformis.AAC.11